MAFLKAVWTKSTIMFSSCGNASFNCDAPLCGSLNKAWFFVSLSYRSIGCSTKPSLHRSEGVTLSMALRIFFMSEGVMLSVSGMGHVMPRRSSGRYA